MKSDRFKILKNTNSIRYKKRKKRIKRKRYSLKLCIYILPLIISLLSIIYVIFHPEKKETLKYKNLGLSLRNKTIKKEELKNDIKQNFTNIGLLNKEIINKFNQLDNESKEKLKNEGLDKCYLKEYFCIYPLLIPKKVIGKNLILVGPKRDGGYVLLDDFEKIKIAYSFGISGEIGFDKVLADKNIDIYMYDHTIKYLPFNNSKFHWKKIGLSGYKNKNDTLKPLKDLLVENGHLNEKNMLLKIDIEYSEWEALTDISDDILKQFKYIILEFHFWKNEMPYYYSVLKKLLKNHQIFYIHCNGCGRVRVYGKNKICNALEVSYVIKDNNLFGKDDTIYPIQSLETKNCGRLSSFDLNLLKFFDF